MLFLAVAGIGTAIGLVIYAVATQAEERSVIRSSLRQLEGYETEDLREQEMLNPLRERALLPVANGMIDVGRRFSPAGYVEKVKTKLQLAGFVADEELDRFLVRRVLSVLMIIPATFVVFFLDVLPFSGRMQILAWLLICAALVLGPDAALNRKVEARQKTVQRALPDVLDLLTISVEAGLGFEQALDRVVQAVPGALSDEFTRMLGETRAGASRREAMIAMNERLGVPEVKGFVLAILQADEFGISIGRVLRSQADEMRIKRRQLAQEVAQKAPVKMLIPMVFCVFPALFVVVLGPAVINISRSF